MSIITKVMPTSVSHSKPLPELKFMNLNLLIVTSTGTFNSASLKSFPPTSTCDSFCAFCGCRNHHQPSCPIQKCQCLVSSLSSHILHPNLSSCAANFTSSTSLLLTVLSPNLHLMLGLQYPGPFKSILLTVARRIKTKVCPYHDPWLKILRSLASRKLSLHLQPHSLCSSNNCLYQHSLRFPSHTPTHLPFFNMFPLPRLPFSLTPFNPFNLYSFFKI